MQSEMTIEEVCATLGILPGSSLEEINKAWKAKCKIHHPDKGGDPKEFIKIMDAYQWLTDPSFRFKKLKSAGPDLNFTLRLSVTWEEMFFGKEMIVGMNQVEIDDKFQQIRKEVETAKTFHLQIPAGFGQQWQKIFHGEGLTHGTRKGDLLVVVISQQNQKFSLRGYDLYTTEELPLDMLVKGGKQEICTHYGLRTMKIKPGTQPGTEIKIKKCGVLKQGDLYVKVMPKFPTQEELKSEKWKGLKIDWGLNDELEHDAESDEFFEKYRTLVFTINNQGL
jgi:DnaJ-class molecular chaperone